MSSLVALIRTVSWRACTAAGLSVVAMGMSSASPVAAANNVRFLVYANDCQFVGTNAGSGKTVKIEWRDDDGNLKSKHKVTSNSSGVFLTRCEPDEFIEFGDELRAYVGGAWRSFTVPRIRMSVLRLTDEVAGDVFPIPDSGVMVVDVVAFNGGFGAAAATTHESLAPVRNDYSFWTLDWDVTPDIKSWDEAYVVWLNSRGDQFIKFAYAPGFRAWIRQPFIEFAGQPPDTVDAELLNSTDTGIATVRGMPYEQSGVYRGTFIDSLGSPVRIRPGYQVDSPRGYDPLVVPDITVAINTSTDRVTVDCGYDAPGSTGVFVNVHSRDYIKAGARSGFQDNASVAVANFAVAPTLNIVSGDKVDVQCKVPETGDIFARTFTAP